MTLTPEEQFWNEIRCGMKMIVAAIEKRYPVLAPAKPAITVAPWGNPGDRITTTVVELGNTRSQT
jgi:hypothetical protein